MRIDRDDLITTAQRRLVEEFNTAFSEGPRALVSTPEWRTLRSTVAEVVALDLSDDGPELHDLLKLVALGESGVDVRLLCQAWREKASQRYARAHASDVAREMAEEMLALRR